MLQLLALRTPGGEEIDPPAGIPDGGILSLAKAEWPLLTIALSAAAIITLIFIIWAGIQWVMSQGDKSKIAQAQARITYAIVGLILIFLSFFIVSFIKYLFAIPG